MLQQAPLPFAVEAAETTSHSPSARGFRLVVIFLSFFHNFRRTREALKTRIFHKATLNVCATVLGTLLP